ncbi:MAG: hypothetical protein IJB04_06020 [Oscillospiraceae bacterium]|nr:hypothetical protein [Oscillospiraceae bacterium]
MAKRKGFMMYFEWVDMMRELDGETFKRLILDMRVYADTGRAPEYLKEEEKLLRMAWALLQNRMDGDAERYADIVQKRKEAAEKRWEQERQEKAARSREDLLRSERTRRPGQYL